MRKSLKFWVFYAVSVGLLATVGVAQGYHRHFHIHQTSLTGFTVTCDNGGDPTVAGTGNTSRNELSVSCGVEK